MSKSHVIVFPDGTKYEYHRDGSVSLTYCDGRGTIIGPEGESYVVDSDGTKHLVLDDGTLMELRCTPVVWFREGRGKEVLGEVQVSHLWMFCS